MASYLNHIQQSLTATGSVTLPYRHFENGGAGIQITGVAGGSVVTFEITLDGTNWVSILAINVTSGISATTASANGIYTVDLVGTGSLRARCSTYGSGTLVITINASPC
jgi:hypothetical protein